MITRMAFFAVALGLFCTDSAEARSFRTSMLPNAPDGCNTCHTSGGGTPRNAFGLAVEALVTPGGQETFWGPTLAGQDSDGDGFTNGQELGDEDGDGVADPGFTATSPGDAASFPSTAGGDTGSGDGSTVVLPEGDVGPAGLDLDSAAGDQEMRQTEENPEVGDQITVDVFVTGGATGFSAFQAKIAYDPAALSVVAGSGSPVDVFAGAFNLPTETDGLYTAGVALLGGVASKDAGSIFQLKFQVLDGFSDTTRVTLDYVSLETTSTKDEPVIGPGAAFVVIGGVQQTAPIIPEDPVEASDFDGDGQVGFSDFVGFAAEFGSLSTGDSFNPRLDLNQNGAIDFGDFVAFAAQFGKSWTTG